MTLRQFGQAALCGLAFLMGAQAALAGTFQVSPIRVVLGDAQPVQSLTIHNSGAQPAVVQLKVQHWTQQAGEEVLADTSDILATPPIVTVPPGESRVLRVGLRQRPDPAIEGSYRLLLQEVPPPPGEGFQGLQVALRLSVPVFVTPAEPRPLDLHWQAVPAGDGLQLSLENRGNVHVQVVSLQLEGTDGAALLEPNSVSGYVLPGQARRWQLDTTVPVPAGSRLNLRARTDAGEVSTEIVAGSR